MLGMLSDPKKTATMIVGSLKKDPEVMEESGPESGSSPLVDAAFEALKSEDKASFGKALKGLIMECMMEHEESEEGPESYDESEEIDY